MPFKFVVLLQDTSLDGPDLVASIQAMPDATVDIIPMSTPDGETVIIDGYRDIGYFLDHLKRLEPDAVVTYNRKIIDGDGAVIPHFLHSEGIPLVLWYIDNPHYLPAPRAHEESLTSQLYCCYDPTYVEDIRRLWGKQAIHLPMGTNIQRFNLDGAPAFKDRPHDIIFVGTLGSLFADKVCNRVRQIMGADFNEDAIQKLILDRAAHLARNPTNNPFDYVEDRDCPDPWGRTLLASLIDFQATINRRVDFVRALLPLGIKVFGDPKWMQAIPKENYCGFPPRKEIHKLYQQAKIVLNVNRMQFPKSVNHRMFDVPACGTAILCESSGCLWDYYTAGDGAYIDASDPLEAYTMAEGWLQRDRLEDLEAFGARGRRAVMERHTYEARVHHIMWVLRHGTKSLPYIGDPYKMDLPTNGGESLCQSTRLDPNEVSSAESLVGSRKPSSQWRGAAI